jgi:hypothetical protein
MKPDTSAANALLQQALMGAVVESLGLSHPFPMLEFRDDGPHGHLLSIDTDMRSNVGFDPALGLTEEEKVLLVFNRVSERGCTGWTRGANPAGPRAGEVDTGLILAPIP